MNVVKLTTFEDEPELILEGQVQLLIEAVNRMMPYFQSEHFSGTTYERDSLFVRDVIQRIDGAQK